MFRNLIDHLTSLHRFSGRESVKAFWTYAAIVIAASFWGMAMAIMPIMLGSLRKMSDFARAHPDQATVTSGPGRYSVQILGNHPELMPDFASMVAGTAIVTLVTVVLLAAAVTRRLHDHGRSGAWGLLPLPFLATGLIMMPGIASSFPRAGEPDLTLFFALFANNVVYLLTLGVVIYLTIKPGDKLANHYGDAPPAA